MLECIFKTDKNILKKNISLTKRDNLSKHVCEFIINILLINKNSYLSNDLYLFNLNLSHFL